MVASIKQATNKLQIQIAMISMTNLNRNYTHQQLGVNLEMLFDIFPSVPELVLTPHPPHQNLID